MAWTNYAACREAAPGIFHPPPPPNGHMGLRPVYGDRWTAPAVGCWPASRWYVQFKHGAYGAGGSSMRVGESGVSAVRIRRDTCVIRQLG